MVLERPYAGGFFLFRLIPWKVADSLVQRLLVGKKLFLAAFSASSFNQRQMTNVERSLVFFQRVQRKRRKKRREKNSLENFCTFHSKSVSTKTKLQTRHTSSSMREKFSSSPSRSEKITRTPTQTLFLFHPSLVDIYITKSPNQKKFFSFYFLFELQRKNFPPYRGRYSKKKKVSSSFSIIFLIIWLPSIFTLQQISVFFFSPRGH